ncbi:hypothetical protein KEM09_02320 [Carboxylicivirga mesophila]|uniref:Uncharacterized protein n=1 Tax=Carboxylicivirga mesophila TaxID=1166478 RepID=A0ABS5K5F0_9BACT|nr:hypothetical protein [Carboxylicivirga mesophila]MBS2210216.1 hypothetical protein [Carboxylicivirga mesophila]
MKKVFPILDWIFIGNSGLIFIGMLFDIEFFRSYPFSERFGFSGIYARMSINDVSLFYLIANFYIFYRWYNKEVNIYKFIIVFGASFFVGTKAIYLQNFLLVSYIVVSVIELRKYVLLIVSALTVVLLSVYNFTFWESLYQKKGVLSVITSLRSDLFRERIPDAVEQMSISSVLFGYRNPFPFFVEMDIIDLFLTIGLIGGGVYIYLYYKILYNYKSSNSYAWLFVICYFMLVALSGRYLYSGVNAIYLSILAMYLRNKQEVTFLYEE